MGWPAPVDDEALQVMHKEVRAKLDGLTERRQRELEYQKKLSEVAESIKDMRAERLERMKQRKNRYALEFESP